MKTQSFTKQERIVSKKLIDELFTGGQSHSLAAFPLRAVWLIRERPCHSVAKEDHREVAKTQLLLSVPKRHLKHAVDRNRVKRQLREAFRKNSHLLNSQLAEGQTVAMAFVWMTPTLLDSHKVEQRVVSLLRRIADKAQDTTPPRP